MEEFLIQLTDSVRVKRNDKWNFVLETLEDVKDRKTKETKLMWKEQGYYGDLKSLFKDATLYAIENKMTQANELEKCYDAIISAEKSITETIVKYANRFECEN